MSRYQEIRAQTTQLCAGLETEDYVVQPEAFVSPPKWHLGHTTWLFENFCLKEILHKNVYDPSFHFLFNSYYESQGDHVAQNKRGALSRPTVREILQYRAHVDRQMREAEAMIGSTSGETQRRWQDAVELGLHHEQQHQELLYMDIKNILSRQKNLPPLNDSPIENSQAKSPRAWTELNSGVYEIGWSNPSFAYDNERPRHSVYLESFKIRTDLVNNGEFLEFIEDGGYARPELWLADGWNWVKSSEVRAPLYWTNPGMHFTLQGEKAIDSNAPVCHVSYFEADAFARWKKCRLPTEAEWELAFGAHAKSELWQWTQSAYLPYPGFKPFAGSLMEYNGKFMSGQMVLRGGCLMTPESHFRPTYRNFFYPQMRWMYSGIRLCAQ